MLVYQRVPTRDKPQNSATFRLFLGLGAGAMLAGHSFALTAAPKPQLAERLGG